jgi:hypothetical protein
LYLFKRANGYYYIGHFIEGRLRWKSTGEKIKSEALLALSEFEQFIKEKLKEITLSGFTEEFLAYANVNYSKNTIFLYKLVSEHLKSICGDCLLSSVTAKHIDRYKIKRMTHVNPVNDRKISPVTINIEIETLRAFFNTAIRWKYLDINPCKDINFVQELK